MPTSTNIRKDYTVPPRSFRDEDSPSLRIEHGGSKYGGFYIRLFDLRLAVLDPENPSKTDAEIKRVRGRGDGRYHAVSTPGYIDREDHERVSLREMHRLWEAYRVRFEDVGVLLGARAAGIAERLNL